MKKYLLSGVALLALMAVAPAQAADLGPRLYGKAPPPAGVFTWSGFYVGGHVGDGWGTTETDANVGAPVNAAFPVVGLGLNLPIGQTSMNGFLGGVQGGYNWQSGVMVFGIEGDISWSDVKGGTVCIIALHCDADIKWMADIAGRVGVAVGDRGLLYMKGGVAWADSNYSVSQSVTVAALGGVAGTVNGSVSSTRVGGLLGGGIEYGFMPGWSAKLEYDYMDFGKDSLNLPIRAAGAIAGVGGAVGFTLPIDVNQQVHTVKMGVNYHF